MDMKYISINTPGELSVLQCKKPKLTSGNAILKLLYGGICGSDVGTYKGTFLYSEYPRIPGHEFSAEIVEIGENDKGLEKGMIVTANPYFNCKNCYSCERGHVNCCTKNETMGAQRDGAFCQYISMPIERIYPGKGLSPKTLALIEPFCISYHGAKRANIKQGEKVLVVGAGTIGYLTAMAAKMMGAEVFVSDIAIKKLEYVQKLGIKGVIHNLGEEDFANQVSKITDGKGFDVCIEAVGLPSTFMNCINGAAYRSRVVIIGIGKQSFDFFYSIIQTKELDIFGSRNAKREDFSELIGIVSKEKIDLESIVSAVYNLDDAKNAFADAVEFNDRMLKVMIKF